MPGSHRKPSGIFEVFLHDHKTNPKPAKRRPWTCTTCDIITFHARRCQPTLNLDPRLSLLFLPCRSNKACLNKDTMINWARDTDKITWNLSSKMEEKRDLPYHLTVFVKKVHFPQSLGGNFSNVNKAN